MLQRSGNRWTASKFPLPPMVTNWNVCLLTHLRWVSLYLKNTLWKLTNQTSCKELAMFPASSPSSFCYLRTVESWVGTWDKESCSYCLRTGLPVCIGGSHFDTRDQWVAGVQQSSCPYRSRCWGDLVTQGTRHWRAPPENTAVYREQHEE